MWDTVFKLKRELRVAQDELAREKSRHMPNLGTISRLDRKVRQIQQKLAKGVVEESDKKEAKRVKALEKKKRRQADPAKEVERLANKAARTAAKAARLKQGRPLETHKPLKSRKPLPKRGPKYAERHEAQFSEADGYAEYIRSQPCIRCQRPPRSEFAHMKGVDLGGKAEHGLPLCGGIGGCHPWQEENKRAFIAEFEERHGISPLEMAAALRSAYLLRKES